MNKITWSKVHRHEVDGACDGVNRSDGTSEAKGQMESWYECARKGNGYSDRSGTKERARERVGGREKERERALKNEKYIAFAEWIVNVFRVDYMIYVTSGLYVLHFVVESSKGTL